VNTSKTTKSKIEYSIFTVCNLAYLPKALVLAESIFKFNGVKLNIFLFDKEKDIHISHCDTTVIWIEDLGVPNLYQLAFKYDIVEFTTSLKPYISLKLLEECEKVIFFDPDICTYYSVKPILNDLDRNSIILTPHYTTPLSQHKKPGWNKDMGLMRFGSFNLGFYAIKNSQQGIDYLKWWSERCLDLCFMESQFGLSTDQKWATIAPCFFPDLHVSFNLGYNVAPWNIFERQILKRDNDGYWVNNRFPLVFFHFSNFDKLDVNYSYEIGNYGEDIDCPILNELGKDYLMSLTQKEKGIVKTNYSFDYMSGGEYISPTLRRAYASIVNDLPGDHDPFDSNGIIGVFAKKNYLYEKKNKVESKKSIGFKNIDSYKNRFRFIYKLMRIILRTFGPNKFHDLSRLMVYLSSYRQNKGLWRI
jgi:hypothetical protein